MIYMDNAATSWPKPHGVYKAVDKCMKKYGANPGRSGHKMAIEAGNIVLYTRENLGKLFNVSDPFQIIFTCNATDSLNLAIKGTLKEGDHVITTSMEHNSVVRPLKELEKAGVKITFVKANQEGIIDPEDIKKAIKSNTRLIISTHASNVTGTIMPIEHIGTIAKEYGISFLVDAAQTAGLLPIDLARLPIDMLAFPGHKSLLGPQGTGGLYIRDGLSLDPLRQGGTGSQSESLIQPIFMPDRYESGTINTPGIAGLGAGIDYILTKGQKNILIHERMLLQMFLDGLATIQGVTIYGPKDINRRAGVVSINIGGRDSSEMANLLDERYNIATRGGLHCAPLAHNTIGTLKQGTVRFSIGPFTAKREIKKCINAIYQLSR